MKPALKFPVWFEAPAEPFRVRPIRVDESTTPRRLALRTMLAARKYTIPGALLTVGHQLGEALVPVIMGLAIDRALATGDAGQLLLWVALLGVNFAVLSYSYRFGSRISYLGMQAIQHELRTRVTDRLLAPRDGDKAALPGTALSIATSDVLRLSTLVAIGVYPIGMLAGVVFCAVVLLTISLPLGLAVLIGTPLLLVLLDKADGPLRRRTEKQQELAADAAGSAADLITGYRVIKGIGAEAEAAQRYLKRSQEALDATLRAKTAQGFYTGSTNLVTGLFIAALAVAAGIFALNGRLSIGELIAVVGLTQFIMSPLQGLAGIVAAFWPPGLASAGRVLPVLREASGSARGDAAERAETDAPHQTEPTAAVAADGASRSGTADSAATADAASAAGNRTAKAEAEPGTATAAGSVDAASRSGTAAPVATADDRAAKAEAESANPVPDSATGRPAADAKRAPVGTPGRIETADEGQAVTGAASAAARGTASGLRLDAVTAGVLRGFDLRVAPGELVGVAAEGEAARVLTELLSLRRRPESGGLTWDDVALAEADPELVRRRVLVAPHAADLFDGSIRDNVAVNGADRVDAALDASGCREFVDVLPDGLDTVVGEGGTRLSGGQRQRVALARALAQPAPLLVLHDPTTAVDSVTEAGIAERLAKVRDGLATLVITSSPALLAACDRVVAVAGGGTEPGQEPT